MKMGGGVVWWVESRLELMLVVVVVVVVVDAVVFESGVVMTFRTLGVAAEVGKEGWFWVLKLGLVGALRMCFRGDYSQTEEDGSAGNREKEAVFRTLCGRVAEGEVGGGFAMRCRTLGGIWRWPRVMSSSHWEVG